MALAWSLSGAVATASMLLAWGFAAFLLRAGPSRTQNRLLAGVLILGGASAGVYFGVRMFLTTEAGAFQALRVGIALLIASPAAYLWFLSTLATPLVKPLRSRVAKALLVAYTVLLEGLWLAKPDLFVAQLVPFNAISGWNFVPGPLFQPLPLGVLAAAEVFGFVAALSAMRGAKGSGTRDAAKAFVVAFGFRDLFGVAFIVYFGVLNRLGTALEETLFVVGIPLADTVFFALLAYGILKTQLFDIDLRVKRTVRGGTVAAVFAAAFFVGSELLEDLIPVEDRLLGVAAAGGVALALRPVQRFAGGIANRLMPGVIDSPDYLQSRKVEVYRAAFESAVQDGRVTEREERVLLALRRELGLATEDVARVERELLAPG